jgi:hypothetical protein
MKNTWKKRGGGINEIKFSTRKGTVIEGLWSNETTHVANLWYFLYTY